MRLTASAASNPDGTGTSSRCGRQTNSAYAPLIGSAATIWPGSIPEIPPPCRGTSFEAKLESLRNKVLREKETLGAQKEYRAIFDGLKAAVAADPEFKRYGELRPKFQQARDLASRAGAAALSEVQFLQQDYGGRYEKAAQPFFDEIRE